MTDRAVVALLGASSLVGTRVRAMLREQARPVMAYSRHVRTAVAETGETWRTVGAAAAVATPAVPPVGDWLCVAPIWVLPQHFAMMQAHGVRRLVALSSTSRFTKQPSAGAADPAEHAVAVQLAQGEEQLRVWAEANSVAWTILRPTLIYGLGLDKNVSEIARFVGRFGFFPVFGSGNGKRQPVHADDVARACLAAFDNPACTNQAYNLSGGETLAYSDMVRRVFAALRRPQRLVTLPLAVFRLAIALLRLIPRYRNWSPAMAARMEKDLVFDHSEAARDLGFSPRPFLLTRQDLPA